VYVARMKRGEILQSLVGKSEVRFSKEDLRVDKKQKWFKAKQW
jgi:hypothetical protein